MHNPMSPIGTYDLKD